VVDVDVEVLLLKGGGMSEIRGGEYELRSEWQGTRSLPSLTEALLNRQALNDTCQSC
jgi:hypothetical protein